MDFAHSEPTRQLIAQVERFVHERVVPSEQTYRDQLVGTADWTKWKDPAGPRGDDRPRPVRGRRWHLRPERQHPRRPASRAEEQLRLRARAALRLPLGRAQPSVRGKALRPRGRDLGPPGPPALSLRRPNARVVKQTLDADGCGGGAGLTPCERVALYPYPGDFERRGLARGFGEYVAEAVLGTETQYVIAGARTVFRAPAVDGAFDRDERLVVPLTDLIQTTSAAFDVRTGRLTEASTYYPNGGRETFLGDEDAVVQPEPMGFTGKEADEEVGVVYFGERYLVPRLGRWASPDPLAVHGAAGAEPLNSYHYGSGRLVDVRDPTGLDPVPIGRVYVLEGCDANPLVSGQVGHPSR